MSGNRLLAALFVALSEFSGVARAEEKGAKPAGTRLVYVLDYRDAGVKPENVAEVVERDRQTMAARLERLGVSGARVARGDQPRVLFVDLPPLPADEVARVKKALGAPGQVALMIVDEEIRGRDPAATGRRPDEKHELAFNAAEGLWFVVRREGAIRDPFASVRAGVDWDNLPALLFTIRDDIVERLRKLTSDNVGRRLAIVVDGSVLSAPTVQMAVEREGFITGRFASDEVERLAAVMGAAPLRGAPVLQAEEVSRPSRPRK